MSLTATAYKPKDGPQFDPAAQGTPGWVKARQGILTASRMAEAMSFLKNGAESAERRQLKVDLLAERLTGYSIDHYVTPAMAWGTEHEEEARGVYQGATGNVVAKCGLVLHPTIEFFGASPDGLLLDGQGLVEIKCPTISTHLSWLLAGEVPAKHKPQMLAQLACTRRRYCDFISYDPRFPEQQQKLIRRFEPSQEEIEAVEEAARQFLGELDLMFDILTMGQLLVGENVGPLLIPE